MTLENIWNEVLHFVKWLMVPQSKKDAAVEFPIIPTLPKKETAAIVNMRTAVIKEAEKAQEKIYDATDAPPLTKEQRIRNILDHIVDEKLSDPVNASGLVEVSELNLIHPDDQPYILTVGAKYAAEKTEATIQRLFKNRDYLYAEWYAYEALSFQWRKTYANLITQAGQLVNAEGLRKFRASLHELWRQTVWADPKAADDFLTYYRISNVELEEFLLVLAEDDLEFLPKTDQPKG